MVRYSGAERKRHNMSRFFADKKNIRGSEIVIDSAEDIHHIKNVLRLKENAVFDVSDSEEWEYKVRLTYMSKKEIRAAILDKQKFAGEPELNTTLFQAVPKAGKMEAIIQKSVELGVKRIVPVFTLRTIPAAGKEERWQKIAAEAVKQCRRGIIPEVAEAVSVTEAARVFRSGRFDKVIFPYENATGRSIKDALRSLHEKPGSLAVIIGPEGGFSDEEAELLVSAGADAVTLGKTILRTETAGPAAIAMIMYELEL